MLTWITLWCSLVFMIFCEMCLVWVYKRVLCYLSIVKFFITNNILTINLCLVHYKYDYIAMFSRLYLDGLLKYWTNKPAYFKEFFSHYHTSDSNFNRINTSISSLRDKLGWHIGQHSIYISVKHKFIFMWSECKVMYFLFNWIHK